MDLGLSSTFLQKVLEGSHRVPVPIIQYIHAQMGFKYNLASRSIVQHTDSIDSQPDIPNSRDSRYSIKIV